MTGAILSTKAQSDAQLEEVRGEARKTIHILHKLQARYTKDVVREYNSVMFKSLMFALWSCVGRHRPLQGTFGEAWH